MVAERDEARLAAAAAVEESAALGTHATDGVHQRTIRRDPRNREARRRGRYAQIDAALQAGCRPLLPGRGKDRPRLEIWLFERERLGPARIVCALILVGSLYALVRAYRDKLVPSLGKLFIPLGQNSLYVYIVQSMLTFILVDRTMVNPWLAVASNLAMVALVWLMVKKRVLFGVIPR